MNSARLAALPLEDSAPDSEVIQRVMAGDTPLYAVLMRRHNQRVFRAARGIMRQDAEAEDVAQQAFLNAFSKLSQFRADASFASWVTTIACNEAFGRLRKEKRHQRHLELVQAGGDMENPPPDPEELAQRREVSKVLEQSIDKLPDNLRIVFMLRDVQELDTAETALCLGLSEEAVRVRLHRARAKMREDLAAKIEYAPDAFHFAGERCDRIVANTMGVLLPEAGEA